MHDQKPTMPARERIWAAIQELAAVGKAFTRKRLKELTELPFHIVDDHMDKFIEDGLVQRIGSGLFEMVTPHEPTRATTVTILEDGCHILECGDQVMKLNPTEARRIAKLMAGSAQEAVHIGTLSDIAELMAAIDDRSRQTTQLAAQLQRSVEALQRQVGKQASLL